MGVCVSCKFFGGYTVVPMNAPVEDEAEEVDKKNRNF